MNKPILAAILAAILATLACTQAVAVPTVSPTAAILATDTFTALPVSPATEARTESTAVVLRAVVNVRDAPGGAVIGTLAAGDTVTVIECSQNWCSISDPAGYVWQGCLTGLNNGLGCEAR